jgi:hypothetical protein
MSLQAADPSLSGLLNSLVGGDIGGDGRDRRRQGARMIFMPTWAKRPTWPVPACPAG